MHVDITLSPWQLRPAQVSGASCFAGLSKLKGRGRCRLVVSYFEMMSDLVISEISSRRGNEIEIRSLVYGIHIMRSLI